MSARAFFAALVVAMASWAATASADDSGAFVRIGIDRYVHQDYEAARVAFARAFDIAPSARTLFNLALAELESDHAVESVRHMRGYLVELDAEPDKVDALRIKWLPRAEAQTSRLQIDAPSGADVTLDGAPQGHAPLPPIDVAVGPHDITRSARRLVARRAGGAPRRRAPPPAPRPVLRCSGPGPRRAAIGKRLRSGPTRSPRPGPQQSASRSSLLVPRPSSQLPSESLSPSSRGKKRAPVAACCLSCPRIRCRASAPRASFPRSVPDHPGGQPVRPRRVPALERLLRRCRGARGRYPPHCASFGRPMPSAEPAPPSRASCPSWVVTMWVWRSRVHGDAHGTKWRRIDSMCVPAVDSAAPATASVP